MAILRAMSVTDIPHLSVLYAGSLGARELCLLRCLALEELGPTVVRFDYDPHLWGDRAPRAVRAVGSARDPSVWTARLSL